MAQDNPTFSPLRAYFWPVRSFELRKFLPLFLIAFFIGFNYNILRNMKDALLVTAEGSGAEVLPFIKVWGILPGAFLITFIYSRLNNRLSRDRVFYVMVGIFLTFLAFFTFVLYPLRDVIHPHATADYLETVMPRGFRGIIAMFRYWSYSCFYIMSDLWSSTILTMLFWGFVNQVTRLGEAKRFYGLIAISMNLAAINSGQVSVFLSGNFLKTHLHIVNDPWHQSLILLTSIVMLAGVCIVGLYRYLTHHVLKDSFDEHSPREEKKKIKMSMRENFAYLARSKYLLFMALIVLSYNIVINLTEVIWKDQVRQLYPDPSDYIAYMSQITSITGVISFALSLLVAGQIIRRFGWTAGALFTPIMLLITAIGFFFFFFGGSSLLGVVTMVGTSPIAMAAFFGSMQNCLSRASKFTLFDATKEMAFIPLSLESKLKGKAAIDGIGSRLGKSTGSLIHQGLLLSFVTISASAHIVAGILFGIIFVWLMATISLGKRFKTLATATEAEEAPSSAPTPSPAAAQPIPEESLS
ncbi:MAG: ADP,ATP carrier protein 1 [Chlamydiales bacterium]|nr:ADP,ATP carrier protein 1 [Chlamydiales bacterium]MCH9619717.1 ADP,ATP carrier protein 1 [Chlamydiales bacterium]MCH9623323.1 ADP,ATP carrier protein 1 [Chlamydiales bacterium]